jgi:hypothetical protein
LGGIVLVRDSGKDFKGEDEGRRTRTRTIPPKRGRPSPPL